VLPPLQYDENKTPEQSSVNTSSLRRQMHKVLEKAFSHIRGGFFKNALKKLFTTLHLHP
jgi:porphobilinogen deaminase